jgi:hypothetical protein
MFIVSPRSTQNYWNAFNYCCNPTFDSDIKARSSAKSNNQMCMFVTVGSSHFLPSKHSSRTSKYSPNNRGLRGQPYFIPCWHLKLEVTWLMRIVSLAYIVYRHRKKCPSTSRPANTCHNISRGTISNVFLKSTK